MDAVILAQTRIVVEVRAANKITDLPAWAFRPIVDTDGVTPPGPTTLPAGIKGRYVEVRANLLRDFGVTASPELRSLTLQHGSAGCAINITAHPKSQAVLPGANASFTVTAQPPPGATATYQWFKDGILLSNGGSISGATTATLTINNAQYTDAARYSVKVGTVSGCTFQLESAPARLHVKGNPPTITQDLPSALAVIEGQNVTLTAQASAGSNLGEKPIFYQWRLNNEPISGVSGDCGTGNCNISRVVAGQCANAGAYSVVFWNQYGQVGTVNAVLSISEKPSLPTPGVTVDTIQQTVTFTAAPCFQPQCVRWYWGSGSSKIAIPGANQLVYITPCSALRPPGVYTVVVADAAWTSFEASVAVPTTALPSVTFAPSSSACLPVNVSLEVPGNTDAVIHYTLDGTPATENSPTYPGNPINITSPVTIRAFGLKNCSVSPETSASYPTGQLPPVVFDPPGSCSLPASVSLSVPGYPEATIHYTVNGDTPTSLSPTYTGPLSITMPTLIKAFARKNGCPDSIVTSAFFGGARNGNQLPINDGGTASCNPSCYPSTIIVSCGAVTISKITVTLYKVSHTWPDDLDILLVGPGGQKLMLMSDAGGNRPFPLNNVTIAFDDDAASPLPDAAQIVSGTYRAADYESPETMPTPAPGRPYSTTLSVFNGTTPNGTWSLYVADDSRGDTGSIAEGWSIAFTFAP